jgi:hypothetical protein
LNFQAAQRIFTLRSRFSSCATDFQPAQPVLKLRNGFSAGAAGPQAAQPFFWPRKPFPASATVAPLPQALVELRDLLAALVARHASRGEGKPPPGSFLSSVVRRPREPKKVPDDSKKALIFSSQAGSRRSKKVPEDSIAQGPRLVFAVDFTILEIDPLRPLQSAGHP